MGNIEMRERNRAFRLLSAGNDAKLNKLLETRGKRLIMNLEGDNKNLLIMACALGKRGIVKTLLNYGAEVNCVDLKGATSLHHACIFGDEKLVQVLLEAGADLSIRDQDNETPILKARRAGHRNLVILLEEHFIRINKLPSLVEKPTDKAATLPLHMKTNSTSDEDRETTGRTVVNDSNGEADTNLIIDNFNGISSSDGGDSNDGSINVKDGFLRGNSNLNTIWIVDGHQNYRRSHDDQHFSCVAMSTRLPQFPIIGKQTSLQYSCDDINKIEETYCKVCWERSMNSVLLFCGHICTCYLCSLHLTHCPICCKPIEKSQRVYLS